jgi:hypothetical protein
MKKLIILFIVMLSATVVSAQYSPVDSVLLYRMDKLEANVYAYRVQRNKAVVLLVSGIAMNLAHAAFISSGQRPSGVIIVGATLMTLVGWVNYHSAHHYFSGYQEVYWKHHE